MPKITVPVEVDLPEAPATPDLSVHPVVAKLMADVARLEERTGNPGADPAVAEALRLANEAKTAADANANRLLQLEQSAVRPATVVELHPPAPLPVPPPDPETPDPSTESPSHPWYHPSRWL